MNLKPHLALLPVALLPLAACASGGGGGVSPEAREASVAVTVENRINPRTDLTVRIITPTGQRVVLGSVGPGRTEQVTYRGAIYEGSSYRLQATSAGGTDILSQPFLIFAGARVVWSLPQNGLTVYHPEGGG